MAYHIEIILAADNLSAINFGGQDHLVVRVRPREKIAERIDDTTATARNDRFGIYAINGIVITRKITPPVELVAGKHQAPSLHGDVPH